MVLIMTESMFTGKRPSMFKVLEKKKKMIEIYVPQKGMMLMEEPQPTTEEVNITVVFSKKEEAELKAILDSIR